jgi:hypothetical protein
MSKRLPLVIGALAVVTLLALLWYFNQGGQGRFDWRESRAGKAYRHTNNQPYGTEVLFNLLNGYFPGETVRVLRKKVADDLPLDTVPASYVVVGEGMFYDSLDLRSLMAFVEKGNTALLCSKSLPIDLMTRMDSVICPGDYEHGWSDYAFTYDTLPKLSVRETGEGRSYTFFYADRNEKKGYYWSFLDDRLFCYEKPMHALGYLNDSLVNFARIPYGKGFVLLHSTPIAFTNFHLLRPEGKAYAEAVLAYLPEGPVYWDAASLISEAVARRRNRNLSPFARELPEEHPLSYLLSHPALAWSWYTVIGLAALYLAFRAKRRQRIIPVLPKNENSSYEFIETIAHLHFKEKNYQNFSIQGMKLFLAQVRERYGLLVVLNTETNRPKMDASLPGRLAQVSEVPESVVQSIFTQYATLLQYEPTESMMSDFFATMDAFWKNAK